MQVASYRLRQVVRIHLGTRANIYTRMHTAAATTIKEKEAMSLKESKVKIHGRIWREERKGGKLGNYNLKK